MSQNLAARSRDERDRINVDLAASGVAYKERLNQPVIPQEVEMQQPKSCVSIIGNDCNITGTWPAISPGGRSCIPERAEK